jgi:deoxyribose-phosphate aldolase
MNDNNEHIAKRALALIDLTDLNATSSDKTVSDLCRRAATPFGHVAAICIWPRFVKNAKPLLKNTGVKLATVINFPHGSDDTAEVVMACEKAILAGADEIDLVFPYVSFKRGYHDEAGEQIAVIASVCKDRALLKVIIEAGELKDQNLVRQASELAIAEGADFIKTSTGKVHINATLATAETMLNAIRAASETHVGFKPAGGIRTVKDAAAYLALADKIMGPDWVSPKTFRFGVSALLEDILATLNGKTPNLNSGY